MDALAPLVARRVQEGWTVQIADVQDVYDEQGFGDKSPAAIRAFIQRARASWRVPPRFVLFVGDATFDPRNFLAKGDFDFVPTQLIDTAAMETASDDWFVDDDLDGVPEIAIGRLPVRTARPGERDRRQAARLRGQGRPVARRPVRHRHRRGRPRLLGRQHGRRGEGVGHHADRSLPARHQRDAGRAARQAGRGAVPGELPRPRFGRGLGRLADDAPRRPRSPTTTRRSTSS